MDLTDDPAEPGGPAPLRGLYYQRTTAEMSQHEVAEQLHLNQSTYSKIERGVSDPTLT